MRKLITLGSLLICLIIPSSALADGGNIIVKYKTGEVASASSQRSVRADSDAKFVRNLLVPRAELVRGGDDTLAKLRSDPRVEYAEVDGTVSIPERQARNPRRKADSFFGQLWGIQNTGQTVRGIRGLIDADTDTNLAWTRSQGFRETVGVVDTGVDFLHPDLIGHLRTDGFDFINNDNDPTDDNFHGTHVSGTIAATLNNRIGIAGVAPRAAILPVKALDSGGSGTYAQVANALFYAGRRAGTVNASLGGGGPRPRVIEDAIKANPSTLYVAAAGNEDKNNDRVPVWPCNIPQPNVVCVGATTQRDNAASFSNYGRFTVDLGAPGVSILSTVPGRFCGGVPGCYSFLNGTSMATPHVAGASALIRAALVGESITTIKHRLIGHADSKRQLVPWWFQGRRLNSNRAVKHF